MAYDKERVRKLVRMLSSNQAGEVFAAAQMLLKHAKTESHDMDQMMAAVYGAKETPSRLNFAYADTSSAARQGWGAPNAWPGARQSTETKLARFKRAFRDADYDLTAWEQDFVASMLHKSDYASLTPNQENVIDKMLSKYDL